MSSNPKDNKGFSFGDFLKDNTGIDTEDFGGSVQDIIQKGISDKVDKNNEASIATPQPVKTQEVGEVPTQGVDTVNSTAGPLPALMSSPPYTAAALFVVGLLVTLLVVMRLRK